MQEFAYRTAGYSRPKTHLNLREAANATWRGITAVVGEDKEPWLVIDFDGKDYILENQAGETQKLNSFDWLPASPISRLVAASRLDASPLRAGVEVDGHKIGHLHYENDWSVLHGNGRLPIEQYIAAFEASKWSFDVGERKDEKSDPLRCPECGGHTVDLIDRDFNRFSCKTCGCQFDHDVMINPKASVDKEAFGYPMPGNGQKCQYCHGPMNSKEAQEGVCTYCKGQVGLPEHGMLNQPPAGIFAGHVAYEVDKGDDYHPYAPGPDDPKKHVQCKSCGYAWESHHIFNITGGSCPRCGEKHSYQQQDVMDLEKGKKKAGINYDQSGKELETGKPYLLHSPRYKVPDLVYIVKSEPTQIEAAIESGEDMHFPIMIDEGKYQKMMYSFEPFISKIADFEEPVYEPWADTESKYLNCPHCGTPLSPHDEMGHGEYVCPGCRQSVMLGDSYDRAAKVGYDYTPTTDSMGGRDTGAPIRDQLPGYGTDIPNPSETAAQPTGPNPLHLDQLGEHGVLFSPRGTVHNLTNMATGSNIMVMSDGQGGVMGWSVNNGPMDSSGINWSTQDLLKVQNAINSGLYQEMNSVNNGVDPMMQDPGEPDYIPATVEEPEESPLTIPHEPLPDEFPAVPDYPPSPQREPVPASVKSHIARKNFSPSEQRELIEEGKGESARNSHKLDLSGTHYTENSDDDFDIDRLFW